MDRRVRRTQEAIVTAFFNLLEERGFEELTVTEIAELADVNRVTFYQHFLDKYDLLEKVTSLSIQQFLSECGEEDFSLMLRKALQYLAIHRKRYQLLQTPASKDLFHQQLKEEFRRRATVGTLAHLPEGLKKTLQIEMLASSLTGLFEWWIVAPDTLSLDEVHQAFLDWAYQQYGR